MAACGSLRHIFENPRRQDKTPQTLLESISPSWTHNPSAAAEDETPPLTEIFGELHFRESTPTSYDNYDKAKSPYAGSSSESLQLCTEGLGFESSYDVEEKQENANADAIVNAKSDSNSKGNCEGSVGREMGCCYREEGGYQREKWRRWTAEEEYPPPPISSIGKNGKPRRSFKAYREEGRFVLEEVKIPTREFLRASREDGRLRMKLIVQPEADDDEDGQEEEIM